MFVGVWDNREFIRLNGPTYGGLYCRYCFAAIPVDLFRIDNVSNTVAGYTKYPVLLHVHYGVCYVGDQYIEWYVRVKFYDTFGLHRVSLSSDCTRRLKVE